MKDRIRKIRKEQNMTQPEFADATGKTRDTIANYEGGRVVPDASYIQLLAVKYGYDEQWILTGEGDPKPNQPLGPALADIATAAAEHHVEEVRKFFRELGDEFNDAEILFLYQIFQSHFGKKQPEEAQEK